MPIKQLAPTPFIKWVGGKRNLIPTILNNIPDTYKRYVEPFVGGGALFFELQPKKAVISDYNSRLIDTYLTIRDNPLELVSILQDYKTEHSDTRYYELRDKLSIETDPLKVAAIFIYLNKTCFNGLYRVNSKDKFNVPLGAYKNPNICDKDNILACSKALSNTDIVSGDFSTIKPKKLDFIYLDPPYHNTFTGYNAEGFGEDRQRDLLRYCNLIDNVGGYFMQSNSDTEFIRDLYKNYNIQVVKASRQVSCKAENRGKVDEVIITNYEHSRPKS